MSEDTVCAVVFLGVLGLAFVYGGLLFHLGRWRSWYLTPDTIFGARPAFYGFVPMGLAMICMAGGILLSAKAGDIATYLFFALGALAVLLSFWQPKWLKPSWVRWLEENNRDILDLIIEEGRKTKDWGKAVATQEGLEVWVAEVRQKHDRPAPVAAPGEVAAKPTTTPRPGRPPRPWPGWPVGLVVIVVSSALGQYLLGSGFIGFIGGWVILGLIYLLRPKE